MSTTIRTHPRRAAAGLLTVCCLAFAACGGDDDAEQSSDATTVEQDGDSVDDSADDTGDDAGSSDVPPGFDIPEGLPIADGLIPELALIPMPEGPAVYSVGSAYGADVDPRETAVQAVYFTISPLEVADFFRTELPAAGFVVVADTGDASVEQATIEFTDPNGLPGHISVNPGNFSESGININLFRSGTS